MGVLQLQREVRVPRFLWDLHGQRASVGELGGVYAGGVVLAALSMGVGASQLAGLAVWRVALVALVALDICGGVLANLAPGTRSYWGAQGRGMRAAFLALHVVHPALLGVALGGGWPALGALFGWMLAASAVVASVPPPRRRITAMALALGGALVLRGVFAPGALVETLGTLYLVKLVYGFGGTERPGTSDPSRPG